MPFYSYSGDPSTSGKDSVRFLLQDKGPDTWLFSDEEINFLLAQNSNIYMAAALGAEEASAKYAGMQDKTIGPLTIRNSDKATNYTNMARRFRMLAARYTAGIEAITTQESTQHLFWLGMDDYPASDFPYPHDPSAPPLASQS